MFVEDKVHQFVLKKNKSVPNVICWGLKNCEIILNWSLSFLQVIALADAVEENQDNLFQSFTKLRSATHLVILLIGLWQKLSPDQVAILEAAFLPLQQDTQELVRTHKPAVVTAIIIEKIVGLGRSHMAIMFSKVSDGGFFFFLTQILFFFSLNHDKNVK